MKGIINYIKNDEFKMLVLDRRINIVNYTNILSMTEERISLTSSIGRVIIKGTNLSVKKLLNKEVLIEGKILDIEIGDLGV